MFLLILAGIELEKNKPIGIAGVNGSKLFLEFPSQFFQLPFLYLVVSEFSNVNSFDS